jgi:molybdopterin synthase catalytic subunit
MRIELAATPFDPLALLAAHEEAFCPPGRSGAAAIFIGTMRAQHEGSTVAAMTLEHYPGMTERHLERIASLACARFPLDDLLVVHRTGRVEPGDPIVLVAVWSSHRGAACDACRFVLEDLKSRAPFWKQEELTDGTRRWVEQNTPP